MERERAGQGEEESRQAEEREIKTEEGHRTEQEDRMERGHKPTRDATRDLDGKTE